MKELMGRASDGLSLAQGIVHWSPPEEALARTSASHGYSPTDGMTSLRDALKSKISRENGLVRSEIMVTAGANQAFTNLFIALLDAGDKGLLFRPYYFNHLMALQMTNCQAVLAPTTADLLPDLDAARAELAAGVKVVTLVNPGNPTGTMVPRAMLEDLKGMCESHGAWLILDNTYEHFAYDVPHYCLEGDNVVNVFSFSKAYGMMGWRIGYIAYPPALAQDLQKMQDTIIISPPTFSQSLALQVLRTCDRAWVETRVRALDEQKRLVRCALVDALGEDAVKGGNGAIYLMAKLGSGLDDVHVAEALISEFGVAVIPGSACGAPGFIRVCYANLPLDSCREAARRLNVGLRALRGTPPTS